MIQTTFDEHFCRNIDDFTSVASWSDQLAEKVGGRGIHCSVLRGARDFAWCTYNLEKVVILGKFIAMCAIGDG